LLHYRRFASKNPDPADQKFSAAKEFLTTNLTKNTNRRKKEE
jgi:hypothetical protein